ncbi:MAG: hypothetical protein KBC56_08950 [Flavobacterium sp.]|nr:hypothetical protein [Flavobacterium sp.]
MKKKRPPHDELLERLFASINLRHPKQPLTEKQVSKLIFAWEGKSEKLYKMVIEMEQTENKVKSKIQNFDDRVFECQIGVDVLGFPIYCRHDVRFERTFTKPSRFSKKGSESVSSRNYLFNEFLIKQH